MDLTVKGPSVGKRTVRFLLEYFLIGCICKVAIKRIPKLPIITVRKRSLRRLCFYTCLSFCPWGVSRPIPRGEVGGSGWGGLRRAGLQADTQEGRSPGPGPGGRLLAQGQGVCIQACTEANTPPRKRTTAADGTHLTGMHSCFD